MSSHQVTAHEHDSDAIDILGFWLYIMTDCILFASLFAVFLVLHQPNSYGPLLKSYIDLYYVLGETIFLLISNFTFGMAVLSSYKKRTDKTIAYLIATFFFGAVFLFMEIKEFNHLIHLGYSWEVSAAASSFFTLVATHGIHVAFGLLWIFIVMLQMYQLGLNQTTLRRLTYLGLFWNFLDIVWIFVFSIVYLMGAI